MAKVVALVSQKGGAGKTTLAVNLAVMAAQRGYQAVILDLDPQASALHWSTARGGAEPEVLGAQAPRLGKLLEQARGLGAELVFIDTAPTADAAGLAAARLADLVLVPCRPSALDLVAVEASVDVARTIARKPTWVVLNAAPVRSPLTETAVDTITREGVPLCPERIHQRAAFVSPMGSGECAVEWEPTSKAAGEVAALWAWLADQLGIAATKPAAAAGEAA